MKHAWAGAAAWALCAGVLLAPGVALAASASIGALYPAAEVPLGVTVTFSVITSGFTSPTFYLTDSFPGGATSVNINGNGDFSWTPNKDEAGTHGLTVTVSDSLGDSATASQTITVDGAASLSITSPASDGTVTVGVPLSATVTPSGLLNPTYTIGDSFSNSSVQSHDLSASGAFNWTPIMQDIGAHTITVSAKDNYGNAASVSAQVTVLPTPTVTLVELLPGTSVAVGQTVTFTASTTGLVSPAFSVSDANASFSTSTVAVDASGEASWTPQYSDVGVHPLRVVATDADGRSASAQLTLTVVPASAGTQTQSVTPYVPPALPQTQTQTPAQTPAQTHTPAAQTKTSSSGQSSQTSTAEEPFPTTQTAAQFSYEFATSSQASEAPATTAPMTPTAPAVPGTFAGYLVQQVVNFFVSLVHLF